MFTHGKINTTRVNPKPKLQPKPVTEELKIEEVTESLKEAEVVRKAEPFIPPTDAELPPDPIIKEPDAEMPKLEVKEIEEIKPRVEKNQAKKQEKKTLLEEILEEEDKEKTE